MDVRELLLLQEAINREDLLPEAAEVLDRLKKDKVMSVHKYTITPPSTQNGRYQTYVRQGMEKRRKVSAYTETGLYDKLYSFYFMKSNSTLKGLYPEWLKKREEQGISARTIRRNINHWDKYYAQNDIVSIPICQLDAETIEQFFHECIKNYHMTVKELGNMKFILTDMMKLARKRKMIQENPFREVDIRTNACMPTGRQSDSSRVYLPDEKKKMFYALNIELKLKPDSTDVFAVFLLFKLALRIGELVAIKREDIDFGRREIHIHRMETLVEDESGKMKVVVVEYTKRKSPYGDRFLPLGDYEMDILQKVLEINRRCGYKDETYIFCDEEGRTKIREIDNLIRKACNKANIEEKSAHDIRRTVASEMFNKGVPVEVIKNFLGHSDIRTTFGYIYDNNGKEATNKMILESLNEMNGFVAIEQ